MDNYKEKLVFIIKNISNSYQLLINNKNNELQYNYSKLRLPNELLDLKKAHLQNLFKNLDLQISQKIKDNFFSLKSIIQILNSNSIDNNLKKGYVLLKKYNKIIKRAKQLKKQDDIQIKFFDKQLYVKIKHS